MIHKDDLWIGSQLFLNEELNENIKSGIVSRLSLFKKFGLKSMMIWSKNPNYLKDLCSICQKLNIKAYLWYGMLADTPINFDANRYEVFGFLEDTSDTILNAQKKGGEDFSFYCPNKVKEENEFINTFKEVLDLAPFDGVFFDRIRFPSPANGLRNIFTCFCEKCRKNSKGLTDEAKGKIGSFISNIKEAQNKKMFFKLLTEFINNIDHWYSFRKKSVALFLDKFIEEAKQRNLDIGIDLFTPSLSKVVSQDYLALSKKANWIKPMIYCKTMGPAGLPMEILSITTILKKKNKYLKEEEILEILQDIFNIILPKSLKEIRTNGLELKNYEIELDKITQMNLSDDLNVYPGFEAVNLPPICSINENILRNYIKLSLEREHKGFILSWDIKSIPERNLSVLGEF